MLVIKIVLLILNSKHMLKTLCYTRVVDFKFYYLDFYKIAFLFIVFIR